MQVRKREKIRKLTGPWISADEAKRRVATALERSAAGMSATLNKGGDLPSYSVRFRRDRDTEVYADVSARGGHLLWMVFDRPVDGRKWTIKQAERKARQFLTRIEYTDMVPISYNETDQIATFNYVHREQGILIYPESVSVKVALDNGEIMGLQANDYLLNRITRPNVRPALTEQEARGQVNPAFRVEKSDLAIIYDKKGNEVLCYDFLGRMDHGQYRVFINAANGEEEYIEKIEKADADLI
jgi:spore germination protein